MKLSTFCSCAMILSNLFYGVAKSPEVNPTGLPELFWSVAAV